MIYLEHEFHGKKFADSEAEAATDEKNGWVRVPYDFDKWQVIKQDERQGLIDLAEKKGIKVDKRWNLDTLKAAVNGNRQ